MKNDFYVELNKIKALYKENMSFDIYKQKLNEVLISIAPFINLGKLVLKIDKEEVIYETSSSNEFHQLESEPISNCFLICKYYPIVGHEFSQMEIEKIQILNEIISLLYNKNNTFCNIFNSTNDIEIFGKYLKENGLLNNYSVLCMNLNNYNYLRNYLGEKTNKLFDLYYQKLVKLLDSEEKIFISSKNNFVVLLKKENVLEFLKFKELIETSFTDDITDCFSFDIRTGIYNIDYDETINESIEKALIALYMAEHVYKTSNLVFTEEMQKTIIKEQRILSVFPKALKDNEFSVYYQPKIDLNTNSMYGSEALVRWIENGKVISPAEFIPILERENILYQLDFYVLEQVCKDMRRWLDNGILPVKTSINFSKKNIRNSNFLNDLMRILNKYKIDSKYIEIELTETVETLDSQNLINFVEVMRKNNINVSIDDFGTGYSSLNLIKNLSANTIKIDKSFIDNIENRKDSVVVSNIIKIALELGIEVIAEGTETIEQVDILYDMGCNKIQGYYFDKPLPKIEFEKRLSNGQFYNKRLQLITKNTKNL